MEIAYVSKWNYVDRNGISQIEANVLFFTNEKTTVRLENVTEIFMMDLEVKGTMKNYCLPQCHFMIP